jgi:hypothetical protein
MTVNITAAAAAEAKSEGLGVNVWYTVPQQICIPVDVAQAAAIKHGFEKDDFPAPSPRTEVSRAAYSMQDRRHKSNRKVTEKTKDTERFAVYGVLEQKRTGEETVEFSQSTTIRFDKETGRVEVEGPLASEFQKTYDSMKGAVTDDDVRIFLRRVVAMCFGIPKRPTGGIWFVPSHVSSVIEKAQKVLDELGTGAKVYLEGVMNGVRERQNVWVSVEDEIGKRIDETLAAVERIEKRASSLVDHGARLDEVKGIMDVYTRLLGEEAEHEDIALKLADAAAKVAAKMSTLSGNGAPASAAGPVSASVATGGGYGKEVINAAIEVLKTVGKPLHYHEIAVLAFQAGLAQRGSNPHKIVGAWIVEAGRNGAKGPFVRVSRGVYGLA